MTKKKQSRKQEVNKSSRYKLWIAVTVVLAVLAAAVILFIRNTKPAFNGEFAFAALKEQVEFGPPVCGTPAHDKTKKYIYEKLKNYADAVSEQSFDYTDVHDSSKTYKGTNIVASFNVSPDVSERVLLCAHWDSRPFADKDPDTLKRTLPVPAANDGASGVAVLLEMARLFAEQKPSVGVDIVFFDLEDIGDEVDSFTVKLPHNPFGIGSEIFVKNNPNYYPAYGILLDMVGDKNLRLPVEAFSEQRAGKVVEKVWKAAAEVGSTAFVNERSGGVDDDHIAFLKKNIPVIDIIQTPFPATWHTTNDIPDSCSAASLQQVGNVLVEVIYNEK